MDIKKNSNYKIQIIENLNVNYDIFSKVVIIGDHQVGKSSIAKKLTKKTFSDKYTPTSGYDFYPYIIKIEDKYINFQIWDMCGMESYRSALFNLYRNATIGILVYSITDFESFKNLDNWIIEMKKNAANSKIILLGNKCDEEEKRQVTYNEGSEICNKYNLEFFMEVSAKNGFPSPNFLEMVSVNLYEEFLLLGDKTDSTLCNMSQSIKLSEEEGIKRIKCCF